MVGRFYKTHWATIHQQAVGLFCSVCLAKRAGTEWRKAILCCAATHVLVAAVTAVDAGWAGANLRDSTSARLEQHHCGKAVMSHGRIRQDEISGVKCFWNSKKKNTIKGRIFHFPSSGILLHWQAWKTSDLSKKTTHICATSSFSGL